MCRGWWMDSRCTADAMRAGQGSPPSGSLAAIPSSIHMWLRFKPPKGMNLPWVGSAIMAGRSHLIPPSFGMPGRNLCNQSVKAPQVCPTHSRYDKICMLIGQPALAHTYALCVHLYVTHRTYTPIMKLIILLKGVDRRNVCSSLIIAAKVRKLCFWRGCECFSCECCGVFIYLFSGGSCDDGFGLREAEDSLLPAFREELRENSPPFDQGRHRAIKVAVWKILQWYKQSETLSCKPGTRKALKMTDIAKKIIEEQMHKQFALLLCLVLRPVGIFTTLVALPVSTPERFIDYIRIHDRIDISLQYLFLGRRRRPYIVFSFRLLYGFMFVTRIYIYRAIKMAALEGTVLERLKSSLLLFRRL